MAPHKSTPPPPPDPPKKLSPAELIADIALRREQVEALAALFEYSYPDYSLEFDYIAGQPFMGWLRHFDYDTIVEVMEEKAKRADEWRDKGTEKTVKDLVNYLSATMHNMKADRAGQARRKNGTPQ